jgi:nuclear pore complex protein Nup93
MDSTGLIPLDGDVAKITWRTERFCELHKALQRNLPTYLTLTMDTIVGIHAGVKAAGVNDSTRKTVCLTEDTVCRRS